MTIQHIDIEGNDVCVLVDAQPCTTPGYTQAVVDGKCICVPPPICDQDVSTQIVITPIEPQLTILVVASDISNILADYQVTLQGDAGSTIELSNDGGVTFTNLNADAYGTATYDVAIDSNAFVSIIRYTTDDGVVVIKQIVFDYFITPQNVNLPHYQVTSITNCTQTQKAELIVTNANVLSIDWVTTGTIEVTQQVGHTLYFTGCGTIGATVYLDCALADNTVESVVIQECVAPTYSVIPIDADGNGIVYMVTIVPNGILTEAPQWTLGNGLVQDDESQLPLMVVLSYDGTTETTLSVTTANTCGDVNFTIPFSLCDFYPTILSCVPTIYQWRPKGATFNSISIFGNSYAPVAPIGITPANQQSIQDYLNNNVANVIGGFFQVQIVPNDNAQIQRIFYATCADAGAATITTDSETASVYKSQVSDSVQLSVFPQLGSPTYQWNLPAGVTLELGTLTSPTIIVSGQGSVTVDVTPTNCDHPITAGPVTIDTEAPVIPEIQHNYTKLYHGLFIDTTGTVGNYTTTYTKSDVRIMYLGTGDIVGKNVTVDWGDGTVDVVPFADDGLGIVAGMTIEHTYANPQVIRKIMTSITDTQGLVFEDVVWTAIVSPIAHTATIPIYQFNPNSKEFVNQFSVTALDVTLQSGNGALYQLPLVDDVRLQQQATIDGVVYPYAIAPPNLDSVGNVITHTLDNTPGIYDIRAEVTRLDVQGNNGDPLNVRYTAYSQFQVKIL